MGNRTGLAAAAALALSLALGLVTGIAMLRCTLLEEDVDRLKARLTAETDSRKEEDARQERNQIAVLALVEQAAKQHPQDGAPAPAAEEPPKEEPPKNEPGGGIE
jgi:hypothetical protein